jgi:hypothetical protein
MPILVKDFECRVSRACVRFHLYRVMVVWSAM